MFRTRYRVKHKYIIALMVFSLVPLAHSSQNELPKNDIEYYFAIKGGISLGSYESGVNWALLRMIEESENRHLKSFSGASAGSLNSVLSVVDYCTKSSSDKYPMIDNVMRRSWDVGLEEMLQHDFHKPEVSLLTRLPIREKAISLIRNRLNFESTACEFVISMSVTLMEPYPHTLEESGETIYLQRFVVPIKIDGTSGRVKFFNYNSTDNLISNKRSKDLPGPYLKLAQKNPHDQTEEVSFEDVVNLALASSAFPVAFESLPIHYCFANGFKTKIKFKNKLCTRSSSQVGLFSDGGMFDNSPIGVGLDFIRAESAVAKKEGATNLNRRLVFINPDHYRAYNKPLEKGGNNTKNEIPRGRPGLLEYGAYLFNSFETASAELYREALIAFETEELESKLFITTRHHNLLADFHAHFGALYSADFRMHDYLVGVYDGKYLEFRLKCKDEGAQSLQCREREMFDWIASLPKTIRAGSDFETGSINNVDERLTLAIEFLEYLYMVEFKYKTADFEIGDNILIALAESFPHSSRQNLKTKNFSFDDFLKKLHSNINLVSNADDKTVKLAKSYRLWLSDNFDQAFDNLVRMQENAGPDVEDTPNDTIASLLKMGEPLINSHLSYYKTGTWPLAFNTRILPNMLSHSFRYGFDISEKSQELEFASRFRFRPRWSFDVNSTFNRFGGELNDDHYWDIAAGPAYHFYKYGVNTLSIGLEYTGKGRQIFKDNLHGIHLSAGLLYELLNLKVSRRTSSFHRDFSNVTRESTTFAITFDLTKIGAIAGAGNLFD